MFISLAMLNSYVYRVLKLKSNIWRGCKNHLLDLLQIKSTLTFSSLDFLQSFEGNPKNYFFLFGLVFHYPCLLYQCSFLPTCYIFPFKKACFCDLSWNNFLIQVHRSKIWVSLSYTLRQSHISEIMCNNPCHNPYPSVGQEKQGFAEVKQPCHTLVLELFALYSAGWHLE